jgi:hypothetical protein
VPREPAVDVAEHDTGLGAHEPRAVLDPGALPVAAHVEQDPVGLRLAVQTRAPGAEHDRRRCLASQVEQPCHLRGVAGHRHRTRDHAVRAGV